MHAVQCLQHNFKVTNMSSETRILTQPIPDQAKPEDSKGMAHDHDQLLTFTTAIVLCVITACITLMLAVYGPMLAAKRGLVLPGSTAASRVVFLDIDAVQTSGLHRALNSGQLRVEDIKKDADKFQADIDVEIRKLTDAGYLVINKKALMGGAMSQDVTADFISALGLKP